MEAEVGTLLQELRKLAEEFGKLAEERKETLKLGQKSVKLPFAAEIEEKGAAAVVVTYHVKMKPPLPLLVSWGEEGEPLEVRRVSFVMSTTEVWLKVEVEVQTLFTTSSGAKSIPYAFTLALSDTASWLDLLQVAAIVAELRKRGKDPIKDLMKAVTEKRRQVEEVKTTLRRLEVLLPLFQ